jgi:hypothetical protein
MTAELVKVTSAGTTSRTPFFYYCVRVRLSGNVCHNPTLLLLRAFTLWALPSDGRYLESHHLTTGLFATIYLNPSRCIPFGKYKRLERDGVRAYDPSIY